MIFLEAKSIELLNGQVSLRKLPWHCFADAVSLCVFAQAQQAGENIDLLLAGLTPGSEKYLALQRILCACVAKPNAEGQPVPLTPAQVDAMPAVLVAELVAHLVADNADFFFQRMPSILAVFQQMPSQISSWLSGSLPPDTA